MQANWKAKSSIRRLSQVVLGFGIMISASAVLAQAMAPLAALPPASASPAPSGSAPPVPSAASSLIVIAQDPAYTLLGDGTSGFAINGSTFNAAAGLAGAAVWPRSLAYLAISGRGGTANHINSQEGMASTLMFPGVAQINFKLDIGVYGEGLRHDNSQPTYCWGPWCLGVNSSLQVATAMVDVGTTGTERSLRATFFAADLGPMLTLNKEGKPFGADFGLGGSIRSLGGNLARDQNEADRSAIMGTDSRTFYGGYASMSIRVGEFKFMGFVPILRPSADNISSGQFLVVAQLQARILSSSDAH